MSIKASPNRGSVDVDSVSSAGSDPEEETPYDEDEEYVDSEKHSMFTAPSNAVALQSSSLIVFKGTNPARILAYNIAHHKAFETIVIVIIIANCVFLALDDPTTDEAPEYQANMEYFFTAAFSAELVIKVFAFGLVFHEGAYLRNSWNVLDGLIVSLSFLAFIPGFGNYTAIRTLRVLRPLRSMNAIPQLKTIVMGLLHSIRGLVNVFLLAGFIFAIFGIVGVQLWKGALRSRCLSDTTGEWHEDGRVCRSGASQDQSSLGHACDDGYSCVDHGNPDFGYTSFDSIWWALLVLFQCITLEGWNEIMFYIFDGWGEPAAIYFVLLVLIGAYFVLNLALAVISSEFSEARERTELIQARQRDADLQKKLIEDTKAAIRKSPRLDANDTPRQVMAAQVAFVEIPAGSQAEEPPSQHVVARSWRWIRRLCFRITEGDPSATDEERSNVTTVFMKFIILCIMINTIVLAAEYDGMTDTHQEVSDIFNAVLTFVFGIEMLLKNIAIGPVKYVKEAFNVMDGLVVVVSFVELGFYLSGGASALPSVSVFRALRLLRVFKLLKNFPSLRSIANVCLFAVKDTGYLNIVVLLYIFIAALIGMQLFGGEMAKCDFGDGPLRSTFDSFYSGFLTIFQIMTRDAWNMVMFCGMTRVGEWAAIFFVLCVLTGDLLILNLFLAILISAFERTDDSGKSATDDTPVTVDLKSDHDVTVQHRALAAPRNKRILLTTQSLTKLVGDEEEETPLAEEDEDAVEMSPIVLSSPQRVSLDSELTNQARKSGVEQEYCPVCQTMIEPLFPPPSKTIKRRHPKVFHDRICSRVQLRIAKERTLRDLDAYFLSNPVPTPRNIENVFGRAWEVGLLLNDRPDSHFLDKTWEAMRYVLSREKAVVDMRLGEEQVGKSLVAYSRANIPKPSLTNGGVSLFIFGPNNKIRIMMTHLINHTLFDKLILICILASSILMAIDNPRNAEGTDTAKTLFILDVIFTAVFIWEMVCKIVALGFFFTPGAYLSDTWNWLDFLIVVISILSLSLTSINISFLKVLRTFRALRPLRVINKNRGIKMVVTTLLQSIKGIANVALISCLMYLVFGILGVQLFGGTMYQCTDDSIHHKVNCVGNYNVTDEDTNTTVVTPRRWVNSDSNFDNIYESILSLFIIATLDDWSAVMFAAIDATGKNTGPIKDNQLYMGLFFVVFIVIGSFFVLNLFVGVVIFNFNTVKSQMDGLIFLTAEQRLWVETQRMMLNFRPTVRLSPGKSTVEKKCFDVARSRWFEILMGVIILLNIVFIASDHHNPSSEFEEVMEISNYVFMALYTVEATIKITAFGSKYFMDNWLRFDFLLVALGWIAIFLAQLNTVGIPIDVNIVRVFRVFRIMRILSLVKRARNIRVLLETLWYSLPSLANIGAFLLLLFFIYSVLGVQIFALVKRQDALNHYSNFERFDFAFLMLIRTATMDNWGAVMHELMITDDCGPDTNPDGHDDCGTQFAPFFFISFLIMAAFVMVNLFVAIILDNFTTTLQLEKSSLKLTDLGKFVEMWSDYDENASMVMPTRSFPHLLARLKPPLGISRVQDRVGLLLQTKQFDIPEHGGIMHFVETLIPLARKVLHVDFTESELRDHEDAWRFHFPDIHSLPVLRYRQRRVTVDQYFSSTYISSAFRRKRARRLVNEMRKDKADDIAQYFADHQIPPQDQGDAIARVLSSVTSTAYATLRQRRKTHRGFTEGSGVIHPLPTAGIDNESPFVHLRINSESMTDEGVLPADRADTDTPFAIDQDAAVPHVSTTPPPQCDTPPPSHSRNPPPEF